MTTRRPPLGTGRTRLTAVGRLLFAALLLAGCATIPTSGQVQEGDVLVNELDPVYVQQLGPRAGATPLEIVQGFLVEQARGLNDDWATAREYLSGEVQHAWNPTARTVIYSREPELLQDGGPLSAGVGVVATPSATASTADESVPVAVATSVVVSSTLDPLGRFTEASTGTMEDLLFMVELDASGEWRITAAEDGIFVSDTYFQSAFRATSLYFPTLDGKYFVPEVRWYPRTNTAAYAVKGVLAGPSEWLRDSVAVVPPDGTRLAFDSVTVNDGTARVELSSEVLAATDSARAMLRAQLAAVLVRLPGIREVDLRFGSTEPTIKTTVAPARDPAPSLTTPLVLADSSIGQVDGAKVVPVEGLPSLAGIEVAALATDADLNLVVLRQGKTAITTVPRADEAALELLTGTNLIAPSIDRFGWLWSGEGVPGGQLSVVPNAGPATKVEADWLADRTVESIQVSRDGARIAVVSSAGGTSRIDIAAIVRADGGTPVRLSESEIVGAAVPGPGQVVWVDESTLGVLASGPAQGARTVYLVPLSGHSEGLSGVDDAVWIAAGRGRRAVYVATADGNLLTRASTGSTWSLVVTGVRLPTFPG